MHLHQTLLLSTLMGVVTKIANALLNFAVHEIAIFQICFEPGHTPMEGDLVNGVIVIYLPSNYALVTT